MKTKALQCVVVFLFVFCACRISFADGCVMPQVIKKMPEMPFQRAIVKHKDGMETLIIEPTIDGEGNSFGWIIPVPGEPRKLEKISSGLLKTMSYQTQPTVIPVYPFEYVLALTLCIFSVLNFLNCICLMVWGRKFRHAFIILFIGCLCSAPVISSFFISYGASSSSFVAKSPVELMRREVVGNYDVFVLKARTLNDLNIWLMKNTFQIFQEDAREIVESYIADGWVFVASKLMTNGRGVSAPHPILMEFSSEEPIYPMKLTAINDATMYLELFIVAGRGVYVQGAEIKKTYCDIYDYRDHHGYQYGGTRYAEKAFVARNGTGLPSDFSIRHPDAAKIMWDQCTVTKFEGAIHARQMEKDLRFNLTTASHFRKEIYTREKAAYISFFVAIFCFNIGMILLAVRYINRDGARKVLWIISRFIFVILAGVASCGLTYSLIPDKIDPGQYQRVRKQTHIDLAANLSDIFAVPGHKNLSDAGLIDLLNKDKRFRINNPYTGGPIRIDDTPGNIIVERDGAEIKSVKIFLRDGGFYVVDVE